MHHAIDDRDARRHSSSGLMVVVLPHGTSSEGEAASGETSGVSVPVPRSADQASLTESALGMRDLRTVSDRGGLAQSRSPEPASRCSDSDVASVTSPPLQPSGAPEPVKMPLQPLSPRLAEAPSGVITRSRSQTKLSQSQEESGDAVPFEETPSCKLDRLLERHKAIGRKRESRSVDPAASEPPGRGKWT